MFVQKENALFAEIPVYVWTGPNMATLQNSLYITANIYESCGALHTCLYHNQPKHCFHSKKKLQMKECMELGAEICSLSI